jgi:transcriptional regulator with XRE-family HTH domain
MTLISEIYVTLLVSTVHFMIDLKARIRHLREFIGCRQEEIADELSMTQAAYSKLETGKTRLDVDRLQQLAMFYGITTADLMHKDASELRLLLITNPKFKDKWGGNW